MHFIKRAWSEEIEKHLIKELEPDTASIRADVEAERAYLWEIRGHGFLITRLEIEADQSKELVLVAIRGKNVGPVIDYLYHWCRNNGVPSMRYHSSRKGAERFTQPMGFEWAESVYRLNCQ